MTEDDVYRDRAYALDLKDAINNRSAQMLHARRIVEDHIDAYGMVPHPDKLKEAIAQALIEATERKGGG